MAVGARMLLLVSETSLGAAWAAFTAAQAPEMERPGEVCPQAEGASSFLLSLLSLPAFLFPSVLRSSFLRIGLILAQPCASTTRLLLLGHHLETVH